MATLSIQQGVTGKQVGQVPIGSSGEFGEVLVSELQARFYELAYRGNLYYAGGGATALSANTITLTATSTPIVGVWNPTTSPVNLVLLQCGLTYYANTLTTPVSPGPFLFAASTGNAAISTGAAPTNAKTLTAAGSFAKAFNGGVALTGLTNNLTVIAGLDIASPGSLTYGTIVAPTAASNSLTGSLGVHNFDGGLIIPPGGVLSIVNTTSSTTFSVATRLLWAEVAI